MLCKIPGCGKPVKVSSKRICAMHDQRMRRHGTYDENPNYICHGMRYTRVYNIWQDMLKRVRSKNRKDAHVYNGKGIKVARRWLDFRNFYEDMGDPPNGMELDRKDSDGNYTPQNCRWATRAEQVQNSSRAKLTVNDVKEIRSRRYEDYSDTKLGALFNVDHLTIWRIRARRSWRNIT